MELPAGWLAAGNGAPGCAGGTKEGEVSKHSSVVLAKVAGCIILVVAIIAALASWQAQPSTRTVVDDATPVWPSGDWTIFAQKVRFAEERGLAEMELGDAIAAMAESFVGTRYVPGTLDLSDTEELVVNFRELDCVTLVETVLAITRFVREDGAEALADPPAARAKYESKLSEIRYRSGVRSGYASRLHYFSDWLADNETRGLLRSVTAELDPSVDAESLNFMSAHPELYRQMADSSVLREIMAAEERLNSGAGRLYVPQDRIARVASQIRNGDVIAATSTVNGLDVAHTGFAFWRDGALHLLHAPLVGKAVEISELPLAERIVSLSGQDGVMVARPIEPRN